MNHIGIGGTLSFDAGPGLHGMEQARHGFEHLDHAREHFQHNLEHLGETFEHFNLLAAGLGIAGVAGLHSLIHSSLEAMAEQEQAQMRMGTSLGIARGLGFKKGFEAAAQQMEMLKSIGIEIGANTEQLYGVYNMVLMPLSLAGAKLSTIREMTKQIGIAAMATGKDFQEMGGDITRFLAGFVRDRDPLFRQLKMSGMVRQDMAAEEIQTMTPQQRLKLIQGVLARYAEGGATVTNTWKALGESIHNIINETKEEFGKSLFGTIKTDLRAIIDYFEHHKHQIFETAEHIGNMLTPAYKVLKDALKGLLDQAVRFGDTVHGWATSTGEFMAKLGVTPEMIHKMAVYGAQFAMVFGTLLPALTLLRTVLGPGLAIVRTAASALSLVGAAVSAFIGPILLGVGLLTLAFLALRKEGESIGDTLYRVYSTYIKPFVDGFMEGFSENMENLKGAFQMVKEAVMFLVDYLSNTFDSGASSAKTLGQVLGNVVSTAISALAKLLAGATYAVSWIIYGFKQVGKYIGESMGMLVLGLQNIFAGLVNILTAPFRAILDFVSMVVQKIASTEIGQKAMKLVGIDPAEVARTAKEVAAISDKLRVNPLEIPDFSPLDETPDEEVLRKRTARLGQPKEQTVQVESKHNITVNSKVEIDGKAIAQAQAAHQVEISERAGAKTSPWQRRAALVRQQPIAAAGAK